VRKNRRKQQPGLERRGKRLSIGVARFQQAPLAFVRSLALRLVTCFVGSAGSARSLALWLVLVTSLGGGIGISWPWLRTHIIHHPYFALGEIQVNAGQRLTPEEVISWSGVVKGMSLWEISPTEVEERLATHPWIRTAHVQRKLPQCLAMTVIERQPVAILADGPFTYLDGAGETIARLTNVDDQDFPYVTGTLAAPDTAGMVKQIPEILALIRQSGWPDPVSEVHIGLTGRFNVFLTGQQITIVLTRERWQEQIPHLATVLRLWLNQRNQPALMDARFAGQIIVRPWQGSKKVERWRRGGAQERRSREAGEQRL